MCTVCERLEVCQLKHLEIKHQEYSVSFSFVISCELESLLLSRVTLTPELARCVGMESTALRKLTLHKCNIPDNACSALIDSLKSSHCVLETIELHLAGISLYSSVQRVLKGLKSSSSSLKRCSLTLDCTSELPLLINELKGNKTLEELTVLHGTGMPTSTMERWMFEEVHPLNKLISVVDINTAIRLLKVSSMFKDFTYTENIFNNCRETLKVQFVD